jgi:flavin-dependent dehydrogenase
LRRLVLRGKNAPMSETFDVAIIGGGPAGTTAATLLARRGRRVVLFERETFPRFKIGESLLPHSLETLNALGVREKLEAHAFPKYGGEIATGCGRRITRFYFESALQLKHRSAYQVERAWFDKMLLDHAIENGVDVRQPCGVERCEFDAEGATLQTAGGQVRARYVLDCSGRNAVVGQQFDLKRKYDHLQKFSVFAHFEGAQRDEGRDGTLTRLVRAHREWFWLIPIDERRTSVGLVMDIADYRKAKLSPEEMLDAAIARSTLMRERMAGARRVTDVHAIGDYSYRNTRLSGPRWLLAGDAAGFIDPIFSTGVFLAIHSGAKAASALDSALRRPWVRAWKFAWYTRGLNKLMDRYLRFVGAWYTEEFIDVFTTPKPPFRIPQAVNSVLGGNIHPNFSVWWRLQLFYLVLWIQKRHPIVKKLEPEEKEPAPPVIAAR